MSSRMFPRRISAAAAQHVRTTLAPVDQALYTEVKGRFAARKRPFEDRIRAYEASQPEPSVADWHACAAHSDAFERGMRVGQDMRAIKNGEMRYLVLVPRGEHATHCTPCQPLGQERLRSTEHCNGFK